MKRPIVISPVLLLTLTAAVGAGYLPTVDPFEMLSAASSAILPPQNQRNLRTHRNQRLAARHWLDQVVQTFSNHSEYQHVTGTLTVEHLTTTLPHLRQLSQSHTDRVLLFDHHQRSQNWLLNLPPPARI